MIYEKEEKIRGKSQILGRSHLGGGEVVKFCAALTCFC